MMLDTLDAAFVRRWQAAAPRPAEAPPETPRSPVAPLPPAADAAATPPRDPATVEPAAPPPSEPPLMERLLAEAGGQWAAIADRIEAARARGRRVIAVAGCERGEGRTTLVAAVASVLRARGRDVVVVQPDGLPAVGGPAHGKRIVIVDAGIWFPPGPLRRGRLLVASHGCEAAILVRRAGGVAAPAIEASLEAIGVEPLGEVLTFAPATAGPEATT